VEGGGDGGTFEYSVCADGWLSRWFVGVGWTRELSVSSFCIKKWTLADSNQLEPSLESNHKLSNYKQLATSLEAATAAHQDELAARDDMVDDAMAAAELAEVGHWGQECWVQRTIAQLNPNHLHTSTITHQPTY
jgi:hypothetical protein